MGIEKPETSLASLIFPLPQVRAWAGFFRTPAPATLAWDSCILLQLFLQIMFPVTGFAWESEVCPSSKKQEQQQWRFSNSGGIGNPQTWMSISAPEQTDSPPAAQPLQLVPTAEWTHRGAMAKTCSFFYFYGSGLDCNLKRMLGIPPARFRLPRGNKAGFKMATLSQSLWVNSTANLFHLFWTHTKFRNSQLKWCQIIIPPKMERFEGKQGEERHLFAVNKTSICRQPH